MQLLCAHASTASKGCPNELLALPCGRLPSTLRFFLLYAGWASGL